MKYLVLYTESGSRHAESTLLTAYFMVMNVEFQVLGDLYLQLKPEPNEHYIVDAQGMGVNKINLIDHDKVSVTCKQAKTSLYDFLKKMSNGERLVPVGHAIKGDILRVCDKLISEGSWEQFCTYHYIDTSVVLQFLRACGKLPLDTDGSVSALADYFGIKVDDPLHDARVDTLITAKIFQKFIELGK